jgi:hypothetical protein
MQVTIIVQAGRGIASVSPAGSNQVYYGGNIYLSCVVQTSPNRYIFSHWQNSQGVVVSRQQSFTLANITAGDTITAVAELDTTQYTVTIITNAAGVTSVTGAGTYTFGTEVTIDCVIDTSNYQFSAWTENNALGEVISNSKRFTLVVNRDITLYPLCESTGGDSWFMYFAIVQPAWGHIEDGDGVVFNNGDWFEFIDGELSEYIAVPASGYEFVKWLFNGEDFSGNTNRQISWGYDPAEHADGTLTAVFQEETETEYTLRMMVSEGYIRAHATLYVKIGNNAEVAYTFASAEDMQNITVPEGSSVRLRVEWDDLFYPATFLGWLNDYTSQAESTSNPYTFTMSANKYITCNLRSDSN